jgi:gas vesicle protein
MKGLLAGLGAGFALGMVIAPQSGEETRRRIAERAEDLLEAGREQARDLAKRGNELIGSAGELADDLPDKFSTAVQQGREQIQGLFNGDGVESALNSISRDDLLSVYGIGPVLADKILKGRPYKSVNELLERGILPEAAIENLKRELLNKRTA